eukprot:6430763-Prymnesium_polylepis.2
MDRDGRRELGARGIAQVFALTRQTKSCATERLTDARENAVSRVDSTLLLLRCLALMEVLQPAAGTPVSGLCVCVTGGLRLRLSRHERGVPSTVGAVCLSNVEVRIVNSRTI